MSKSYDTGKPVIFNFTECYSLYTKSYVVCYDVRMDVRDRVRSSVSAAVFLVSSLVRNSFQLEPLHEQLLRHWGASLP